MNSLQVTLFLNKLEVICLSYVKWFQNCDLGLVILFIKYSHLI